MQWRRQQLVGVGRMWVLNSEVNFRFRICAPVRVVFFRFAWRAWVSSSRIARYDSHSKVYQAFHSFSETNCKKNGIFESFNRLLQTPVFLSIYLSLYLYLYLFSLHLSNCSSIVEAHPILSPSYIEYTIYTYIRSFIYIYIYLSIANFLYLIYIYIYYPLFFYIYIYIQCHVFLWRCYCLDYNMFEHRITTYLFQRAKYMQSENLLRGFIC